MDGFPGLWNSEKVGRATYLSVQRLKLLRLLSKPQGDSYRKKTVTELFSNFEPHGVGEFPGDQKRWLTDFKAQILQNLRSGGRRSEERKCIGKRRHISLSSLRVLRTCRASRERYLLSEKKRKKENHGFAFFFPPIFCGWMFGRGENPRKIGLLSLLFFLLLLFSAACQSLALLAFVIILLFSSPFVTAEIFYFSFFRRCLKKTRICPEASGFGPKRGYIRKSCYFHSPDVQLTLWF